jgi:hypothetical protein
MKMAALYRGVAWLAFHHGIGWLGILMHQDYSTCEQAFHLACGYEMQHGQHTMNVANFEIFKMQHHSPTMLTEPAINSSKLPFLQHCHSFP